jgi:hypothetical protein
MRYGTRVKPAPLGINGTHEESVHVTCLKP